MLGHAHPAILRAVADQAGTGLLHRGPHFQSPVQVALMERLANVLPPELCVLHPVTNGTEATEVEIKAVVHATGRNRFLAFSGSYHGRSLGDLALSHERGANSGVALPPNVGTRIRAPFHLLTDTIDILPDPDGPVSTDTALTAAAALLEQRAAEDDLPALVLVEAVQAVSGLIGPDTSFLRGLSARCHHHDVPSRWMKSGPASGAPGAGSASIMPGSALIWW